MSFHGKLEIKGEGILARGTSILINGRELLGVTRAELTLDVDDLNKLRLEKYTTTVDTKMDVIIETKFILPENLELAQELYDQLKAEYGEELKDA